MRLAIDAALRSTCLSRMVGAVIVLNKLPVATGYVGACSGMTSCLDEKQCYRRANKLHEGVEDKHENCRSAHAEVNAITSAVKRGVSVNGATIYTTLHPCYTCSKLIVQSGIKEVVYGLEYKSGNKTRDDEWERFLKESGIKTREYHISYEALKFTFAHMFRDVSDRRLAIFK